MLSPKAVPEVIAQGMYPYVQRTAEAGVSHGGMARVLSETAPSSSLGGAHVHITRRVMTGRTSVDEQPHRRLMICWSFMVTDTAKSQSTSMSFVSA